MERFGAVVAGADTDAVGGEEFGDVVRMDVIDREGDETFFLCRVGRPDDADVRNGKQSAERSFGEFLFLPANVRKTDGL